MRIPASPVRFDPSVERPEEDEAETGAELIATMRKILETTYKDYSHAVRSVHAKSHGLLQAELEIPAGLPPVLSQGLFAQPGRYPVVMRFSTNPGDILDDRVSVPRGLAIKVSGVRGERLPGAAGSSQDFVMVNGPAFLAKSGKAFLKNLKLLAGTTDKAEGAKIALSAALRGLEKVVEAVGGESSTLKALGGHPMTHILGESFYSQAPIRFGDYIAKVSVAPVSSELLALTDAPLDLKGHPNGIREAVIEYFRTHSGVWDLRVQLCTDLESMPVEDSTKVWSEEESPYLTVGRITAGPQISWNEPRRQAVDDAMAFSPWHGLVAHRPLGSIMRLRKATYESSAQFRSTHNRCPVHEPELGEQLPN